MSFRLAWIVPFVVLPLGWTAVFAVADPAREAGVSEASDEDLACGCILTRPLGRVPEDLYAISDVVPSNDYAPFTKQLTACGVTLVAGEDVDDEFLKLVGRTIGEILSPVEGIDVGLQKQLIRKLYEYRAVIPVPRSERSLERMIGEHEDEFDALQRRTSICDIIMSNVDGGQVMEVVEHVLHIVTDVGLHYQFPDQWGLSRESELWRAMQVAIEAGAYDIGSYDDLGDLEADVRDRILMQEFAYWVISTEWGLQEDYGPNEPEWTLTRPAVLRAAQPEFLAVVDATVGRVLRAPTRETLAAIGPTRLEERGR